ncbi:MAG TPA: DUF4956 domain-containing protein [Vicinamibacterales bacterium]|nr:DUF4956 domain-containing protein [Vicinamibacterales bacterium]
MPEWLTTSFGSGVTVAPQIVLVRLIAALLLGGLVSQIYKRTQPADEIESSFPPTLVLLCVLIAMVTQVVGDNVARAFSLVGALSIVRFRTVVRDTEDTAYVIFAVVVGMAVGAGAPWVAVLGLAVVAVAAVLMMPRPGRPMATPTALDSRPVFSLQLRGGLAQDVQAQAAPVLDAHVADRQLVAVGTAKQGLSIDVTYDVRLRANGSPEALVRELNRLDGMQSVELRAKEAL